MGNIAMRSGYRVECLRTDTGLSAVPFGSRRLRVIERRRHERFSIVEPVSLGISYARMGGWIVDLSALGAAVEISDGFVPGIGESIGLTLRDRKHFWGRACRINDRVLAIEFLVAVDGVHHLLWPWRNHPALGGVKRTL